MTKLLPYDYTSNFPDFPAHMTEIGKFVYYRTYSRFLPKYGRRETWNQTVSRATEYNVGLAVTHLKNLGIPVDTEWHRKEAEQLFQSSFNLRQFLSGRTQWIGGAEGGVAEKYPLANFNCSFINIDEWGALGELFYLLMVGTGVGFKATKEMAAGLAPIRTGTTLLHSDYKPVPKFQRLEKTDLRIMDNGFAKIYVGDSKEGWVESLRLYLEILTDPSYENIHTVKISYNSVRPKAEPLKTFGGTASGPEPLREMFEGIDKVLKNQIDPTLAPLEEVGNGYSRVRPVHILDIGNLIGNNVVVGGVRRTAEIFLMDADDFESMFAKYGLNGFWKEEHFQRHEKIEQLMRAQGIPVPAWFAELGERHYDESVNGEKPYNFGRPLHHRRMSNNSIAFTKKPSRAMLNFIFEMMQLEGEPGFINLEEAARRRFRGMGINNPTIEQLERMMFLIGLNPCAEILLQSRGVCNLTTVNLVAFVIERNGVLTLDLEALIEAQKLSARAGLRMTLATLELPRWNKVQQTDRLLGTSLTGVKDAMAMLGYDEAQERSLLEILGAAARNEADRYAKMLRVNSPLLVTTVKPEGTISLVAGAVSSGLHMSHSPYYIRRIRINAADPLAKAVMSMGWPVNPEVGTPGADREEQLRNARTLVIDFPVASGATLTKTDVNAAQQLDTYFRFQEVYTEHNSSNTLTIKRDDAAGVNEWAEAEEIIFGKWDEFTAVSFLSHDGGTYKLAPYEEITKEQYEELAAAMPKFDPDILPQYEQGEDLDIGDDGCEAGACPVR